MLLQKLSPPNHVIKLYRRDAEAFLDQVSYLSSRLVGGGDGGGHTQLIQTYNSFSHRVQIWNLCPKLTIWLKNIIKPPVKTLLHSDILIISSFKCYLSQKLVSFLCTSCQSTKKKENSWNTMSRFLFKDKETCNTKALRASIPRCSILSLLAGKKNKKQECVIIWHFNMCVKILCGQLCQLCKHGYTLNCHRVIRTICPNKWRLLVHITLLD